MAKNAGWKGKIQFSGSKTTARKRHFNRNGPKRQPEIAISIKMAQNDGPKRLSQSKWPETTARKGHLNRRGPKRQATVITEIALGTKRKQDRNHKIKLYENEQKTIYRNFGDAINEPPVK